MYRVEKVRKGEGGRGDEALTDASLQQDTTARVKGQPVRTQEAEHKTDQKKKKDV